MARKPSVDVNPVANQYTAANERIIEFHSGEPNGPGGLIGFYRLDDGTLNVVSVYRTDEGVSVQVSKTQGMLREVAHMRARSAEVFAELEAEQNAAHLHEQIRELVTYIEDRPDEMTGEALALANLSRLLLDGVEAHRSEPTADRPMLWRVNASDFTFYVTGEDEADARDKAAEVLNLSTGDGCDMTEMGPATWL